MSANLISNKTLSNSVIPFANGPVVINVFTSSSDFVVPNWYYSLSAILVSGGGSGGWGGGGGAGGVACIKFHARPGDILTGVIGAGGSGITGDGFSAHGGQGGTTSLSRNGVLVLSISGGSGGDWVAAGYGNTTNFMPPASHGSAGGAARLAGVSRALQYYSVGAGETVDFFCNFNGGTVSVSGTLLSAVYLAATSPLSSIKGLGSPGGKAGNNSTNNGSGGGGGFGISATPVFAPSGVGGAGGHAGILIFPAASGGVQKFVLAGGGGGVGDGDYVSVEGGSATYPGGPGGSVTYEGTTYVVGGSGGATIYQTDFQDPPETTISYTSGSNGAINTGSGGGGSGNGDSNGGSGIIILLGQRSYPFSGKPI